jgi:hypothetical protein
MKPKVFRTLSALSIRELKKLKDIISNPYFNKNNDIIRLYDLICKYYPEFNITKKEIHEKLYNGKKFNDARIRKLLTCLNKLTEHILIMNYFRNNKIYRNQLLFRIYADMNLYSQSRYFLKQTEKYLYSDSDIDPQDIFANLLQIHSFRKILTIGEEKTDPDIDITTGNILAFYFIVFASKIIHNINISRLIGFRKFTYLDILLPDEILVKLSEYMQNDKSRLARLAYIYLLMLLANGAVNNLKYYYSFKSCLIDNLKILSHGESYNLFLCLQRIVSTYIRNGLSDFETEKLSTYKLMLNKKLYSFRKNGFMPYILFRSVIISAIKCGDIQYCETVTHDLKNLIHPKNRNNVFNYSMSLISFSRSEYDKALAYLYKIKSEGELLKTEVIILKIKILYESNNYSSLSYSLDSISHSLPKLSEKKKIKNFLTAVKELIKIRRKGHPPNRINEILREGDVYDVDWIREKLKISLSEASSA